MPNHDDRAGSQSQADQVPTDTSITSFRTYKVQRNMDVRIAATAVMREDFFPDVDQIVRVNLSTIILELGTNIIKYAGSGRILLRCLESSSRAGIEVLAVDSGPGIPDMKQAMKDHFSTGKSLGLGLGGVQRLASEFSLTCPEEGGTRVRAICWWRICHRTSRSSSSAADIAQLSTQLAESIRPNQRLSIFPSPRLPEENWQAEAGDAIPLKLAGLKRNRPALHQTVSGDALVQLDHGSLGIRIVIDGAGHGPAANKLSSNCAEVIHEVLQSQLASFAIDENGSISAETSAIDVLMMEAVQTTHARVRSSRGVAFGMAVFDCYSHRLHFLGIGNTRIIQLSLKGWEGVSRDGQLGVSFKRPVIQHYSLSAGDVILQCSDGIRTTTLRGMRPKRRDSLINMERVADALLAESSFSDDVSILMTHCRS